MLKCVFLSNRWHSTVSNEGNAALATCAAAAQPYHHQHMCWSCDSSWCPGCWTCELAWCPKVFLHLVLCAPLGKLSVASDTGCLWFAFLWLPVFYSHVCLMVTVVSCVCNECTSQNGMTPRIPEAGSATRLAPQSPVSKSLRKCFLGITNHIQTSKQTRTNQMTIYSSVEKSICGCGMSCEWWLCMVCDSVCLYIRRQCFVLLRYET